MAGMQKSIQSLRAIAAFFVLLFHLWDDDVSGGYLGVDVFFIISGYIMCMLINKVAPLNLQKSLDFYYRRIKRIVPLYLFLITIVLFLALFLVAPYEYHMIFKEAWSSSIFVSNIFQWNAIGRYVEYLKSKIIDNLFSGVSSLSSVHLNQCEHYRHTWSLSCEIQFYLVVPILFCVFQFLDRAHKALKFGLMLIIGIGSFAAQSLLTGDLAHMLLVGRLWQFMLGFIAYHLHESGLLNVKNLFKLFESGEVEKTDEDLNKDVESSANEIQKTEEMSTHLKPLFAELIKLLLVCLLFYDLSFDSVHNFIGQLHRLSVVVLTTLIMAQNTESYFLTLKPVVALGDCSYSVYLIHWPLFAFYRYWHPEHYAQKLDYSTFIGGMLLICSSIILGYLMEETFKFICKFLSTWIKLLALVVSMYLCIGALLLIINSRMLTVSHDQSFDTADLMKFEEDYLSFYKKNFTGMTPEQSVDLNSKMDIHNQEFFTCAQRERVPTNYSNPVPLIRSECTIKGAGTKNIVLIGNSHAASAYFGVKNAFKDTYSKLTIMYTLWCMPFLGSRYSEEMQYKHAGDKYCAGILSHVALTMNRNRFALLEQWKEPIDVIIVSFAYFNLGNPTFNSLINNEYFQQMQKFFNRLSKIAKEMVLIPDVHVWWPVDPLMQILNQRLYFNGNTDLFEMETTKQNGYLNNIKLRFNAVECPKCVKVKWANAFCDEDGKCNVLDANNLSFMRDWMHVNLHGSMAYGNLLRKLYEQNKKSVVVKCNLL
ncbi:Acyl-transf-3 domain-containing protein [Aphelenchoides bicaudatus]|nr:Acyl-transf-3 domain-containing protein [Aphelenchoides bicaudatus]